MCVDVVTLPMPRDARRWPDRRPVDEREHGRGRRPAAQAASDNAAMSSRSFPAWHERPRRAAAWLLSLAASNVEGAIYGTVVIGVLFAAEDARRVGYPETIEAALLALALYWLTGFYAHELGIRLQSREHVNLRAMWRSCVHELTIIEGALIPVLVLLIAWAAGAGVNGGVTAAVWTTAATILALEVAAGYRARLRPKRLLLQTSAGVAMGLAIVALRLILH